MPLRHHQRVAAMPGADVEEGDSSLVLVDPPGGQLPRNDLAEDAVGVERLESQASRGASCDDVLQFLAGGEATQLGRDESVGAREEGGARPRRRGARSRTPGVRQSGCSGGSGSGSVTSSAARIRPVEVSASSASVSTSLPRATLTSTAPSGSAASCGTGDHALGLRRVRRHEEDHIGVGQQLRPGHRSRAPGPGPVRGRRATLVTEATSKPDSRRSIAAPMWP